MKIKVYYIGTREVEIEVDDKYQRLVSLGECWASELTEEEWEEMDCLRDELACDIGESDQIGDDDFIRFTCAETLNGAQLYEW